MVAYSIPYRTSSLDEDSRAIALRVLEAGLPTYGGNDTETFEVDFARFCGVRYGVVANSGTSALLLVLLAAGIGRGSEVILGANDYIGCLSAIAMVDAIPVLVDTEPDTGNIRTELISARVTPNTRAIVASHMYGHPCDLQAILAIAKAHGLLVIEDFAHALGARYEGRPVGSFGDVGFCSFGGKHITVFGPGGGAVTADRALAEAMSSLRDQGRNREHRVSFVRRSDDTWYDQRQIGLNLHMSEVSAALGRRQLEFMPDWHRHRRDAATFYSDRFRSAQLPIGLPPEKPYAEHAYLHYTIMTPERDALHAFLAENGVETQIHYPQALHRLEPVRTRWPQDRAALAGAEQVAAQVLSFPVGPHMGEDKLIVVADLVERFFDS